MFDYNLPSRPIEIITPQRLVLNGFLFSPSRAKILFIFVHGLSGGLFSRIELAQTLAASGFAVLTFNNRGSGFINKFKRFSSSINNSRRAANYKTETIGEAHEVFTDCIDDLDGAVNFGIKAGYKKIILLGHSTGCNKIAYYLAKKSPVVVKGVVFCGPMSDYALVKKETPVKKLTRATAYARRLIRIGRGHNLLPNNIWPEILDAQRFLSLYTADSIEEIFSYAVPTQEPIIFRKIGKPLLVVLAEQDEFRDRPMNEIAQWFKEVSKGRPTQVKIIKNSIHSFFGHSQAVKKIILNWLKNT